MRSDMCPFEFGQFLQEFAVPSGHFFGDFQLHMHVQIAASSSVRIGHALFFDFENGIRLSPGWDCEFLPSFEKRDFQLRTQDRLGVGDRDMADEMDTLALKEAMFPDLNIAVEISGRSSLVSRFPFAPEAQLHSGIDSGRDADFE